MAAGKTFLQLTNEVLARLRENSVDTVNSTTYSTLIGKFINEAKKEVEDAWNWNRSRTTVTVTTADDTFSYVLTDAQKRFRIIDVFNDTQDVEMRQIGMNAMNRLFYNSTQQKSAPIYYNFNGSDTNGNPQVDLYPIPDKVYTIRFNMCVPQADLSADTDTLTLQEMPVILGAYARAVLERGEDGGINSSEVAQLYRYTLNDAISQDAGLAEDELIFHSV